MNKISLILLSILLGSLLHSCNDLSPREKCLENNACKNRAQACFSGFIVVSGATSSLTNSTPNSQEIANLAVTCNALQKVCEADCNIKYSY
ncbi:LA_0364 family Cys-rich lipoprotein [Leptospira kmetyi]|uniref:LA_0364 family Cys-rich lipoprotein n=1 Tax=Leptospira kmetyi TaxID=408139 RepID=UPI0026C65372